MKVRWVEEGTVSMKGHRSQHISEGPREVHTRIQGRGRRRGRGDWKGRRACGGVGIHILKTMEDPMSSVK